MAVQKNNDLSGIPFDELTGEIEGELYTDDLRRLMLSTDASPYQLEPAAILYPKHTQDVVKTVHFAKKYNLSIHPRGAGSGLCGSSLGCGIIVDFTKFMNRLRSFDPSNMSFSCEPGYSCGELDKLLEQSLFFFPPSPLSSEFATFGGMYSTNAGGNNSIKYGNTADYLLDAEVVLADGSVRTFSDIEGVDPLRLAPALKELYHEILQNKNLIDKSYSDTAANVCGYELRGLAVDGKLRLHKLFGGAEGTLGIITRLWFGLKPKVKHRAVVAACFNDIVSVTKASQLISDMEPTSVQFMDKSFLQLAADNDFSLKDRLPLDCDNLLVVEFEADDESGVDVALKSCTDRLRHLAAGIETGDKELMLGVFKSACSSLYRLTGHKKAVPLISAAIPSDRLVAYVNGLYKIFEDHRLRFSMNGDIARGLLNVCPLLDMKDIRDIDLLKTLNDEVFALVRGLGGTISGEYGDGRIRSCYIPLQYNDIYEIFLQVKRLLDPSSLFNHEIITHNDSEQMKKHLRYGDSYNAPEISGKLLIWENGMNADIEKCHGCSECTAVTDLTRMCPVYKVSRDEAGAPKAKANILRALISGKIDDRELYSSAFKAVLDRCINCGSCAVECPSKVDIPKLVQEAKSQYAQKYGMSLEDKIFASPEAFGRYAGKLSPLIALMMRPKPMRRLAELASGLSAERRFIKLSTKSLLNRYPPVTSEGQKKVLYFAGCYASYVRPEIGESLIAVMNHMGYKVYLPDQHCCGMPHLSKGSAAGVQRRIEDNFSEWGKLLDEVDHIVVSCSSCGLSLTKEWGNYMGGELIEKVKGMTRHISEFVSMHQPELGLQAEGGVSVAYHMSCHMRLMDDSSASKRVLSDVTGMKTVELKSNCCGMAGSWGLSAKNYAESLKIAAPMIEDLIESGSQICATDCPACEMQLRHLSDKPVFHPVELVDKMLKR